MGGLPEPGFGSGGRVGLGAPPGGGKAGFSPAGLGRLGGVGAWASPPGLGNAGNAGLLPPAFAGNNYTEIVRGKWTEAA